MIITVKGDEWEAQVAQDGNVKELKFIGKDKHFQTNRQQPEVKDSENVNPSLGEDGIYPLSVDKLNKKSSADNYAERLVEEIIDEIEK